MTLKTLFVIPIAIIMVMTLSLAGMIAGQGWSNQEHGRAAVRAVEQMRLLLQAQRSLMAESAATNLALTLPPPLETSETTALSTVRATADQQLRALVTDARTDTNYEAIGVAAAFRLRLDALRKRNDKLIATERMDRTFREMSAVTPALLDLSSALEPALLRVSLAVTEAEPELTGLLTVSRLAASLRLTIGAIASLTMPRFNLAEPLTDEDVGEVRALLREEAYSMRLLDYTMEIAGPTDAIRAALDDLKHAANGGLAARMNDILTAGGWIRADGTHVLSPQQTLLPWGQRINVLRAAITDAVVNHVIAEQIVRDYRFDLAMTAFGVVIVAILEAAVLLSQRVVGPLAQLGAAITRIAAGDRGVPRRLQSGTREIAEMVTAVETLRRAALVADAAEQRHRTVALRRLEMLREALAIIQKVQEPARALERGVANLANGIDATIALISAATAAPSESLLVAAAAVRACLKELRASEGEPDAGSPALDQVQSEYWAEADVKARILAVQAQVGRREAAVRGFVQPGLVALHEVAKATTVAPAARVRDLVSDQFQRIEESVATVAAMLASVRRATAIVRSLPTEDEVPPAALQIDTRLTASPVSREAIPA